MTAALNLFVDRFSKLCFNLLVDGVAPDERLPDVIFLSRISCSINLIHVRWSIFFRNTISNAHNVRFYLCQNFLDALETIALHPKGFVLRALILLNFHYFVVDSTK